MGGNITGPNFMGTITSGSTIDTFLDNNTVTVPEISLWGITGDSVPFYVTATGVGGTHHQFVRFVRCNTMLLPHLLFKLLVGTRILPTYDN